MPTAQPALTLLPTHRSHLGQRPNNEDAVFATPRLLAVADGVGGATAGEVASQIVIQEMASLEKRRLSEALADELHASVRAANQTLEFLVSCRPQLAGMASTLTAVALANDGTYLIANVGDSRAYLLRQNILQQLTRDESLVQMLLDNGAITPGQARTHPQRSVVLNALDGVPGLDFELSSHQAKAGDRLLLCSDGLSDVIPDAQIATILKNCSRDRAAERLVEAAIRAGGADNISLVVADVVPSDKTAGWLEVPPPPSAGRYQTRRRA